MSENLMSELLLLKAPSVFGLYEQINEIALTFVAPLFLVAILIEFCTKLEFFSVLKKLLFITLFIHFFYGIHTQGANLSLKLAGETLEKVSPNNLFLRKWYTPKVTTTEKSSWSWFKKFAVPNLNDLIGTALYVISQIFLWLLKLIYSTVYHLVYVFSGITATLYFLGWTQDALKGSFQASVWCMILPFVVVSILALVGGSISQDAFSGELIAGDIDQLIWLFGVTLLLLTAPVMAYGMVKGDGVHAFGGQLAKMGMMGVGHAGVGLAVMSKGARFSKIMAQRWRQRSGGDDGEGLGGGNGSAKGSQIISPRQSRSTQWAKTQGQGGNKQNVRRYINKQRSTKK
jgi:hypothetical protein